MNSYTGVGYNSFGQNLVNTISNWGSNLGTAAGMTSGWAMGSGARSTIFVGRKVANAWNNAYPTGTCLSATLVLACSEYLIKLKDRS